MLCGVSDAPSSSASLPSVTRWLRAAARAEGISYLALLAAMAAKYAFHASGEGGVPVAGPIHGVIVLVYGVLVLMSRTEQGWSILQTLLALVLSAVPGGGFYVEQRMITAPPRPD